MRRALFIALLLSFVSATQAEECLSGCAKAYLNRFLPLAGVAEQIEAYQSV